MNISEISKLDIKDLKSIDYRKAITKEFSTHPEHIVAGVIIMITVLGGLFYFFQRRSALVEILRENKQLENKVAAFDKLTEKKNEFAQMLTELPAGYQEDELAKQITNMAIAHNIHIESFTPINAVEEQYYEIARIRMDVTAENYEDIWQFMYHVENSAYALRVDQWAASIKDDQPGLARQNEDESSPRMIRVSMEIASIDFKKDK